MKTKSFLIFITSLILAGCSNKEENPEQNNGLKITLDKNVTYQTIEGFGGFGAIRPWWVGSPPFHTQTFVDRLINDFGLTILRDNVPTSFELTNDNDDPNVLELENFNVYDEISGYDGPIGDHIEYLKAMKNAGLHKFIASIWSPPAWMKENNNHEGEAAGAPNMADTDNKLKTQYYDEFAEYCVAYVKFIEQETGLVVYALSLQNEPAFTQSYESCVYSPQALTAIIKKVGARFEQEGITTKIFMPEDVQSFSRISGYVYTALIDPAAKEYTDIIATHNYALDGITAGSSGPDYWTQTYEIAKTYDKQLWMTETSGFNNDWGGAYNLALSIYNALKFGKVNAWVWWALSGQESSKYQLMIDGEPTKRYYTSKQFYKYVRPGAVQIKASSEENDLLILAFDHPQEKTETIVVINNSAKEEEVSLQGVSSSSFQVYRSSANEDCELIETVDATGKIKFPISSVTTLYGSY